MPDLKRNFLKGRMNKDLDERLVPNGEYRDALNIEVSTSEGSDVGTVQNIKGNLLSPAVTQRAGDLFSGVNSYNIIDLSDPTSFTTNYEHGALVKTSFDKLTFNNSVPSSSDSDGAVFYTTKNILTIGETYTVSFDISIDHADYDSTTLVVGGGVASGTGASNDIRFQQTISSADDSDATTSSVTHSVSGTFVTTSATLTFFMRKNSTGVIRNINVVHENQNFLSTSASAQTVGSHSDTASDKIYNFVSLASSLTTTTFTNINGQDFTRDLGIKSDAIIEYTPTPGSDKAIAAPVLVDVFEVVTAPKVVDGVAPMSVVGNAIIQTIKNIPLVFVSTPGYFSNGVEGYYYSPIKIGMKVDIISPIGNSVWGANNDVRVTDVFISNDNKLSVYITMPDSAFVYDSYAIENNYTLKFTSDRILKFKKGSSEIQANLDNVSTFTPSQTSITAINVVDNYLFWTDGRNEPKKINIDKFKEGSVDSLQVCTKFLPDNIPVEERHTTVIKENPKDAPILKLETNTRKGGEPCVKFTNGEIISVSQNFTKVDQSNCVVQLNAGDFQAAALKLHDGSNVYSPGTTFNIVTSVNRINWKFNDIIKLVGQSSEETAHVRVVSGSNNNDLFNAFSVELLTISSGYATSDNAELWNASLDINNDFYLKKFISFAVRYKYENNEYSCISPYSKAAFEPGRYNYNAVVGENQSMENHATSLYLKNIVPKHIPEDVKSVDIILKDNVLGGAFVVETIKKDSTSWNNDVYYVTSEVTGTTIGTLQLNRVYDSVPVKAKAQEFVANRLMYGNYSVNYDMKDNGGSNIEPSINVGYKSFDYDAVDSGGYFDQNNDVVATTNYTFNEQTAIESTTLQPANVVGLNNSWTNAADADAVATLNGWTNKNFGYLLPIISDELIDNASTGGAAGTTGNYQDFSVDADAQTATNLYHLQEPIDQPFIYKVPADGEYTLHAHCHALALRKTIPFQPAGVNVELSATRPPRQRIEIHKVNISGVSLGIITNCDSWQGSIGVGDGGNYVGADGTSYNGYAASHWKRNNPAGSPTGSALNLYDNNAVNHKILNDGLANNAVKLEIKKKVTLSAGEYIGVFHIIDCSNTGFMTATQNGAYQNQGESSYNTFSYNLGADSDRIDWKVFQGGEDYNQGLDGSTPGVNFSVQAPVTSGDSTIDKTSGSESIKSLRDYNVGIVYCDLYGRESTVMVGANNKVNIPFDACDKKNILTASIASSAPGWATHYKYFIKENTTKYENVCAYKIYPNGPAETASTAWIAFDSNDVNKISEEDILIPKKKQGSNFKVNRKENIKILAISDGAPVDPDNADGTILDTSGDDAAGKFFVQVPLAPLLNNLVNTTVATTFFQTTAGTNNNTELDGAVFEVLPKSASEEGFYYETSRSYPIRLDKRFAEQYFLQSPDQKVKIQIEAVLHRDTREVVTGYDVQNWISNWNNYNSNNFIANVTGASSFKPSPNINDPLEYCQITSTETLLSFNGYDANDYYILVKFEAEDKTYVTALADKITTGNVINLHPYTHRVSSSLCSYNKVAIPWFNCFTFGNGVESDTINDRFNEASIYPYLAASKASGFKSSDYFADYGRDNKEHDIIFSQLYNEASKVDGTNQFILADNITKKLNGSNGAINALVARDNDVIALCEDKVLRILSSGKDALFNADGNIQLTSSRAVLGQSMPFAGDFGCQNAESIARDEYRIYFVDKARSSALRLSRDGLTVISDVGMKDWFSDQVVRAQCITGSFDDRKSEYNISIHEVTNPGWKKNVYTLSYNEDIDGWSSFKSFIKESACNLNNKYYSFKNGQMYIHHPQYETVNRNNFYSVQYNSSVTPIINDQSDIVKSFSTISYEGSQAKVVKNLDDNRFKNNVAKKGWYVEEIVTDQQTGSVDEFINKEGKWYNSIKGKTE